jgi:hypothetical protein
MVDNRDAVTPELLLMRHGAGIKPWQDPAKVPPGPGDVLTAEGYREAQAVGDILAETLKAYTGCSRILVRYAGRPATASTATWSRWGRQLEAALGRDAEPAATARVVAQQLTNAGIEARSPKPWPRIQPERIPPVNPDRAAIVKAARALRLATGHHRDQGLLLVVGNSPQVEWIAEELLGRPVAIGRGEIICIGNAARRRRWSVRRHRDVLWTIGPSERATIDDLREKIRSKMDTAKFLGTFITALVTFVLGKRFDATKSSMGTPVDLPAMQDELWVATIAALGVAALLCYAAVFYYDSLLMPTRFWAPSARPGWFKRWRPSDKASRTWWLAQRPPSSPAWVLQQNMMRIWSRLVVVAMWVVGIALSTFAVLVLAMPQGFGDLSSPFLVIAAVGILAVGYVTMLKPRLGVED